MLHRQEQPTDELFSITIVLEDFPTDIRIVPVVVVAHRLDRWDFFGKLAIDQARLYVTHRCECFR